MARDTYGTVDLSEIPRAGLPLDGTPELLPSPLPTPGKRLGDKVAEYQLLVAVLEDAVHCFQQFLRPKNQKERALFADAEMWIMGSAPTRGCRVKSQAPHLSFEYVCEVLDLEPESVREKLRHWRRSALDSTRHQAGRK